MASNWKSYPPETPSVWPRRLNEEPLASEIDCEDVQYAPDLLPEYEATVGSMLRLLRGLEGRQEGDPRKIADVIVQLANNDEVPVRLILGVHAEKRVQRAEAARASEAEEWRHLICFKFEDGRFDGRL